MAMRRISVDFNELSGLDVAHDVQNKYANVVRNSSWSKDNRYDKFSVQTGMKPNEESIVTSTPNYRTINYEFILWTAYMEQMNTLIEGFVEETMKYWGGDTNYKFLCTIDSVTDAAEMSADTERFIKASFVLITKAYLLPEFMNSTIKGKVATMQRQITPSKVVFGYEGDATNEQVGSSAEKIVMTDIVSNYDSPTKPSSAKIKPKPRLKRKPIPKLKSLK